MKERQLVTGKCPGVMKLCCVALFCVISFFSAPARAVVGVCESDDGAIAVSIITNDNGQLLDLAVTVDDTKISRFPAANNTSVALPSYRYKFSARKTARQEALDLDISGKKGKIKYGGKNIVLECNWQ
jgi:hypothetical protein